MIAPSRLRPNDGIAIFNHAMPKEFAGLNTLDNVRFRDLPKTAKHNRQAIAAWLMIGELDRLLQEQPSETLKIMRRTLRRYREARSVRGDYIDQWEQLLDGGPQMILSSLREDTDRGAHQRQMAPVSGLFGIADRDRILRAANRLLDEKHIEEKQGAQDRLTVPR